MRKILPVAAGALVLLSACTDVLSPTLPARPRLDTGWMGGGGRAAGTDSTSAATAPAGAEIAVVDADSAASYDAAGSGWAGSGN